MECPKDRLRVRAAEGGPSRSSGGTAVLDHSERKPPGNPVSGKGSVEAAI